MTRDDLDETARRTDDTPMEVLGWLTPAEGMGRADGTTRSPRHTRPRAPRTINPNPQHKAVLHFKLENGLRLFIVQ